MSTPAKEGSKLRAVWLVLGAIVSVQVGAAFAKSLFGVAAPPMVAWLRLLSAAAILLVIARPRLTGRTGRDWTVVAAYSVSLFGMNWTIYESFARIPIGLAVTIEFLGPLAVALFHSRHWRDLLWVGLAATGVLLLGAAPEKPDLVGVLLAVLAGGFWASYILLSGPAGQRWEGISGVTVANVLGAIVLAVPALLSDTAALNSARVLLIGASVGLLSSVIPYSLELTALRSLPPRVFSILMSLEPAVAALAALVVLHEGLGPIDLVAMACVVAASLGVTRAVRPASPLPVD